MSEQGSDKEESSSSMPTATGRAFLRWLQSKGALVDGETEGTPVTWPPPTVDDATNEGDAEEASPPAEEEEAAESPEAAGGDGEEGGDAGEAAADEGPTPPSLTTLQALTAFYRAIGPVAAAAEEEAAREDAEQARYDAEEAAAEDAEAAGEEETAGEETKDTKEEEERARLDAEATRLARAVDCEATFPEFFEALGRCADAAVSTEGASLGEKLATFFAKLEEKVDDEKDA